ncbi:hypothetical protein VP01_188g2 [Puccinia sorghi]|uniref:Uncharacterized protein n=1 Tax=Puccinia sorghi TaxID=27349 RepID=A0A0L6VD39_9BASI|nr:hypothetical protein VP01_188g2 [Puccinia sorghi]
MWETVNSSWFDSDQLLALSPKLEVGKDKLGQLPSFSAVPGASLNLSGPLQPCLASAKRDESAQMTVTHHTFNLNISKLISSRCEHLGSDQSPSTTWSHRTIPVNFHQVDSHPPQSNPLLIVMRQFILIRSYLLMKGVKVFKEELEPRALTFGVVCTGEGTSVNFVLGGGKEKESEVGDFSYKGTGTVHNRKAVSTLPLHSHQSMIAHPCAASEHVHEVMYLILCSVVSWEIIEKGRKDFFLTIKITTTMGGILSGGSNFERQGKISAYTMWHMFSFRISISGYVAVSRRGKSSGTTTITICSIASAPIYDLEPPDDSSKFPLNQAKIGSTMLTPFAVHFNLANVLQFLFQITIDSARKNKKKSGFLEVKCWTKTKFCYIFKHLCSQCCDFKEVRFYGSMVRRRNIGWEQCMYSVLNFANHEFFSFLLTSFFFYLRIFEKNLEDLHTLQDFEKKSVALIEPPKLQLTLTRFYFSGAVVVFVVIKAMLTCSVADISATLSCSVADISATLTCRISSNFRGEEVNNKGGYFDDFIFIIGGSNWEKIEELRKKEKLPERPIVILFLTLDTSNNKMEGRPWMLVVYLVTGPLERGWDTPWFSLRDNFNQYKRNLKCFSIFFVFEDMEAFGININAFLTQHRWSRKKGVILDMVFCKVYRWYIISLRLKFSCSNAKLEEKSDVITGRNKSDKRKMIDKKYLYIEYFFLETFSHSHTSKLSLASKFHSHCSRHWLLRKMFSQQHKMMLRWLDNCFDPLRLLFAFCRIESITKFKYINITNPRLETKVTCGEKTCFEKCGFLKTHQLHNGKFVSFSVSWQAQTSYPYTGHLDNLCIFYHSYFHLSPVLDSIYKLEDNKTILFIILFLLSLKIYQKITTSRTSILNISKLISSWWILILLKGTHHLHSLILQYQPGSSSFLLKCSPEVILHLWPSPRPQIQATLPGIPPVFYHLVIHWIKGGFSSTGWLLLQIFDFLIISLLIINSLLTVCNSVINLLLHPQNYKQGPLSRGFRATSKGLCQGASEAEVTKVYRSCFRVVYWHCINNQIG